MEALGATVTFEHTPSYFSARSSRVSSHELLPLAPSVPVLLLPLASDAVWPLPSSKCQRATEIGRASCRERAETSEAEGAVKKKRGASIVPVKARSRFRWLSRR